MVAVVLEGIVYLRSTACLTIAAMFHLARLAFKCPPATTEFFLGYLPAVLAGKGVQMVRIKDMLIFLWANVLSMDNLYHF